MTVKCQSDESDRSRLWRECVERIERLKTPSIESSEELKKAVAMVITFLRTVVL